MLLQDKTGMKPADLPNDAQRGYAVLPASKKRKSELDDIRKDKKKQMLESGTSKIITRTMSDTAVVDDIDGESGDAQRIHMLTPGVHRSVVSVMEKAPRKQLAIKGSLVNKATDSEKLGYSLVL